MENQTTTKIRAILTGATGMVGEGVLHECLQHKDVEAVLVINRKPAALPHPKLKKLYMPIFLTCSPSKASCRIITPAFFAWVYHLLVKEKPCITALPIL